MNPNGFQQIFGTVPAAQASAPGRVNLLGEHTDYNDGFVLPTAIPQHTTVQLGPSPDQRHHLYSEAFPTVITVEADDVPAGFARYLVGCLRVLAQQGMVVPPLQAYVASTVPLSAGLSSSAALEIALLRALRSWLRLDLDDVRLAQMGQQAEREYAGVQCGILDQMAASLATPHQLLFLDTRTLEHQLLPFPAGAEMLVLHSGIPRNLAETGYNQRRRECETAAHLLGVKALRDVTDMSEIAALPPPLQQRAHHVITENQRVLSVRTDVSAAHLGALMDASHASLRDDYEVSVPALDRLVTLLQQTPGVFGAKLTGAGFGGACVALVAESKASVIAASVLAQYQQAGYLGYLLVPPQSPMASRGAGARGQGGKGEW
jgi:galactokinase